MCRTNGGRSGEWFMTRPPLIITPAAYHHGEQIDGMVARLARTLSIHVCKTKVAGTAA